jgi:small redox-active disulfide protein 2
MKLQVLGSGCAKCLALENNTREAVEKTGLTAEIEKITDTDTILEMGVILTPALAVDGVVKKTGSVPSVDEIAALLKGIK